MPALPPQKVAILGAGAAGCFTAYRLSRMYGGLFDVTIFEKSARVGGNTWTQHADYGGVSYSIDCGAQFFYKTAQPSYVKLIEDLGLFDEGLITREAAGFSVWDVQAQDRRLWIPARLRRLLSFEDQDWDALIEFFKFFVAASQLDNRLPIPWDLDVQAWLDSLDHIDANFREQVIKPFLYQFTSLPLERAGEASAPYAITYLARSFWGQHDEEPTGPRIPTDDGLAMFYIYQSLIGLDGIMLRALDATQASLRLGLGATAVARTADHKLSVTLEDGSTEVFDHVVMACDPNTSAQLLEAGGSGNAELIDLLKGLEYIPLSLSIQKDGSCWMPSEFRYWEPVNTLVDRTNLRFSAWFGPLRHEYFSGPAGGSGSWKEIPVFKSWGASDLDPAACDSNWIGHTHHVLLPTTSFCLDREALMARHQGRDNVWFAGGWTNWFDSQEAALDSATRVAEAMTGAVASPGTGLAHDVVRHDPAETQRGLEAASRRIARFAGRQRRKQIYDALEGR